MLTTYRLRWLWLLALPPLWALLSGSAFVSCSVNGGGDGGDDGDFNHAPRTENSYLVTRVNTLLTGFLQAEDRDGDSLTFRIVDGPTLGFIDSFNSNNGRFTYISNSTGVDRFIFVADDGRAVSNTAAVTITVNLDSTALQPAPEAKAASQPPPWAEAQPDAPTVDPFNIDHWLKYVPDRGVSHSGDAGASWTLTPLDPALLRDGAEAIVAGNGFVADLIYLAVNRAGGGYRLLRSVDGGRQWLLIGFDPAARIAALTSGPMRADGGVMVYARLDGQIGQLLDYP